MPLFRKHSQSQAQRLASWRSEVLRGAHAADGVGALLDELGATSSEERKGWVVEMGAGRLFIAMDLVEGRSLRYAGDEAKLGPTLSGVDSATLLRTLLPRAPIDTVDPARTPGATVAAAMLDTAYQLK